MSFSGPPSIVSIGGATLLAIAFVLPVGDAPWYSFWREWTASIAVLLIAFGTLSRLVELRLPLRLNVRSTPALALALSALCWLQYALGQVPYVSDALLPSLYLAAFALCWTTAASLPEAERDALAYRIAAALLAAALLSVPLAVGQWLGWLTLDLGVPVVGGRPVAHMEQANLLCSLLIQGVIGLWRLQARARLGPRPTAIALVVLLPVIVLTQSRVAWLVAVAALIIVAWRRDLVPMRTSGRVIVAAAVAVVIAGLLLPAVDSSLGIAGASLAERTSQGRRPAMWALFIDAAAAHPLLGWGVLQNGAAQLALASRHPSLGWYFSSAHNVVLDLVLWFGIPVGLVAGAVLYLTALRRVARAPSTAQLATAFAAVALLMHALVELPLHYAYFLLPLGLLLGTGGVPASPTRASVGAARALHRVVPLALALLATGVLGTLAREYIAITDSRPIMAFDKSIWHAVLTADPPAPDVMLLDRLRAFHAFAATPLRDGLPQAALDESRAVMHRTPFAPVIERAALIAGLNGRTAESQQAIALVCRFEPSDACEESRRVWGLWRARWPQLAGWPDDQVLTPG